MATKKRKPTVRELEWLTIRDVAESLVVCPRTVRRWIENGGLKATRYRTEKAKSHYRISREDFLAFAAAEQRQIRRHTKRQGKVRYVLTTTDPRQKRFPYA